MNYSLAVKAIGDSFLIAGRYDSLRINSQLRAYVQDGDSATAAEVHGLLTKRSELELIPEHSTPVCSSSSNSMLSRIHELIIPYPAGKFEIGTIWSDTVSTRNCHGKTPFSQQMIRQFEVKSFTTWQGREVVEIQRLVSSTFTGISTGTNSHLQATGSGSGIATLILDRKTAVLLESNSQTKSSLTITTSRGEFPFTQLISTHIRIQ